MPKDTISVFVYKDKGISTPLNALRAELTSSLINSSNSSYVVLDRSEEILEALRSRFQYQESGLVRDDQLVAIGKQLGEKYLYVVSVVFYQEFGQYFFEGKFINMETAVNPKQALYPDFDKGQPEVTSLTPQNQIRVGRELAEALGIMSAEEIASRKAARVQQEKERQAAINRQQRAALKAERATNLKSTIINAFNDWYSAGLLFGGGSNGFKMETSINVKFINLGVGLILNSDEKYFPICNDTNYTEEKYYINPVGWHFSAGINFKYFGISICPELFSINDLKSFGGYYKFNSEYVMNHYSHTLLGFTPTIYFNVPFQRIEDVRGNGPTGGIIGSAGYTFLPTIGYNPGFQFSLGFGLFW